MSVAPYPLRLEPILLEKVWGGRRLAQWGRVLPRDVPIGESWEVADLLHTSASGAGGGAQQTRIINGALAGCTLREAIARWGRDFLGAAPPSADGGFPLLVKLLDAREPLSVQVHPSAAYAAAHPEAHLKTESWYVVDAEPGAELWLGVRSGVGVEEVLRRAVDGTIAEVLVRVPAIAGDCHTLPSGLVHALGAGVLVAEVQTPSDTTFRLYDWARERGRTGRALHLDESRAAMDLALAPAQGRAGRSGVHEVARTEHYELLACATNAPGETLRLPDAAAPSAAVVLVLQGALALPGEEGVRLEAGGSAVVPAACQTDFALRADGVARALVARAR